MPFLREDQKLVEATIHKIAERELAPRAAQLDQEGGFPVHSLEVLAANGFLNPLLPEKWGGIGVDHSTFALILTQVARVCASSALLLIAQADGSLPIIHGGSPEQQERYLSRLGGDSRQVTALAATEPEKRGL